MGKKRCATGYNLFIKDCYDKGDKTFAECLMSGEWKALSDKEKEEWNEKARDLCDV